MMVLGLGGLGLLSMFVFPLILIGLAIWFINHLFPHTSSTPSSNSFANGSVRSDSAFDILQQRYVNGELTRSEYEAMRRDLLNDAA